MAAENVRVNYLTVWITLLVALVLQVMPMPDSLLLLRPYWMAMTLVYWTQAVPLRVGMLHGFVAGLLLDLLDGSLLGQNALLLSGVCFMTLMMYQRMRVYSLWQQIPLIVAITAVALLVKQGIGLIQGAPLPHVQFMAPALVSGLLWPWFFTLMHKLKRLFG